ncbi:MAG: hypothetical protein QW423_02685 [Candidatus Aenigmatarchaeota archaeon]
MSCYLNLLKRAYVAEIEELLKKYGVEIDSRVEDAINKISDNPSKVYGSLSIFYDPSSVLFYKTKIKSIYQKPGEKSGKE